MPVVLLMTLIVLSQYLPLYLVQFFENVLLGILANLIQIGLVLAVHLLHFDHHLRVPPFRQPSIGRVCVDEGVGASVVAVI